MKIESYCMQASSERVFHSVDRFSYRTETARLPLSEIAGDGEKSPAYLEAVKYTPSDEMKKIIEEARSGSRKSARA